MSSSFTLLVDDNGKIVRWEVVVRMVLVMTKHLFSLLINGEKGIVLHQPHCRHSAAVFLKKDWNRVGLDWNRVGLEQEWIGIELTKY